MFEKLRNPMKKYGMRKKDVHGYYVYHELQFGATDEMLKEMKRLNKVARKLGDRRYFIWPVGGLLDQSVLVVGRRVR